LKKTGAAGILPTALFLFRDLFPAFHPLINLFLSASVFLLLCFCFFISDYRLPTV
jgi:hypothetical protein